MYFKKLEIVGFKSFLNKTTLHFEPGVTAVVGPNGCGKSNIFDSIRWVLGEQSVKALRGSKMEDVIFNGADNKEPLGLAEVSLTLSNETKLFPIEDKEFTITRRIFRSGESEYLLNKVTVRLKDISELLMGTGVGAEAYSLVEQGKIDLILSSRPEDRRMVFDEASGITKYKAQKKEALRKLEETEQNLLRINDIITEVKRQIGSLERQANKARRYKEVFDELKSQEILLASRETKEISQEKEKLLAKTKELEEAQQKNYDRINEIESRIKEETQKVKSLEDTSIELRNQIMDIDNLIARNEQHVKLNQERIEELASAKKFIVVQITQVEKRIELDEQKLINLKNEFSQIKKTRGEKDSLLKLKGKEQDDIAIGVKSANEKIAQAKKAILELAGKQSCLKNNVLDLNARIQSYLSRQKRLDIEKAKILEEKVSVEGIMTAASAELNNLEAEFNSYNNNLITSRKQYEEESRLLEALKLEIQELEKNRANLLSQKDFLDKLKLKYEEETEAMNAVVLIEGEPKEKLSGIVVKIRNTQSPSGKDREIFNKADYKLFGEAKPIPLNTEAIEEKINETTRELDEKTAQRLFRENNIRALTVRMNEQERQARDTEIILNNKRVEHKNISRESAKINEEREIVELEFADVTKELETLYKQQKELNYSLSNLERENKTQEEAIAAELAIIGTLNLKREENLVLIAQVKTELLSIDKRASSEEETLKISEDSYRQDKNTLEDLKRQASESDEKAKLLALEIQELEKNSREALVNKGKIEKAREELQSQNKKIFTNLDDDNKCQNDGRKAVEEIKTQLYNLQMQNQEWDFKSLSIKERVRQAYKVDLDAGLSDEANALTADMSLDSLPSQIQALKTKLDSYGTVNLVAIEEYDELKIRYEFLNQQQTDLLSAKESLHEAILKINRTTKKMFLETFGKIATEFRSYFKLLFGGGDASVFLIDEGDPLESGIEIICRPPGKKLQNVLLLSGGEKAMSAIALLFAIFKVKPSPFCILDEIDAALDEANVDRYGRILQEFAQQSQFIVITHNKRTIVNADVMYGITMEESGVSKIVSVKLSKDRSEAEEPSKETETTAVAA